MFLASKLQCSLHDVQINFQFALCFDKTLYSELVPILWSKLPLVFVPISPLAENKGHYIGHPLTFAHLLFAGPIAGALAW